VQFFVLREQAPARHYALTLVMSAQMAQNLGLFAAAILGAWTAQEYGWRTLALLFSRGTARLGWLLARWASSLGSLALVMATPMVLGLTILSLYHGNLPAQLQGNGLRLLENFLRLFLTVLPYLSLALFVAVAARSVAATLGGVLGFGLVLEAAINQLWPHIGQYFPAAVGKAWLANPALNAELGGLLIYTLGFLALAGMVLKRQDLGG
jgi:ABC-type transport system involved in multi-copper enzyme maturation permease subunit